MRIDRDEVRRGAGAAAKKDKPITEITITKSDWSKGMIYCNPHDCLLARAAKRVLGKPVSVVPGGIRVKRWIGRTDYTYDVSHEGKLMQAHHDKSLLPITIPIKCL